MIMLTIFLASVSFAADMKNKNGSVGAQFLKIGVGARASGMSGAFVAISNDISAVYYNPGGLTNVSSLQAMFTMINLPADIKYQFAAAAIPIKKIRGVIAVSFANLNSGDMKVTTPMRPFGTGENFCTSNIVSGITYASALTDRFSFGMTMKAIGLYSFGYSTHSMGVDIGTLYRTGFKGMKIGARIANFGSDLKYIDEAFPMPVMMEIGSAVELINREYISVSTAFQGARINDSFENYTLGFESRLMSVLCLRTGYRWLNDSERFSFGAGVIIPISSYRIIIDYSYTDMHYLTNYQRFSVLLSF